MTPNDRSDGRGGCDGDQSDLHEDDAWWLRDPALTAAAEEPPEELVGPAAAPVVWVSDPEPAPEPGPFAPAAAWFADDVADDSGDYTESLGAAPQPPDDAREEEERDEVDEFDSYWPAVPAAAAGASLRPDDDEVIDVSPGIAEHGEGDGGDWSRRRRIALAGVLCGVVLIALLVQLLSAGGVNTTVRAAQPKRTTTTEPRGTTSTTAATTTTLATTTTGEPTTAVPPTIIPSSIAPQIVATTPPAATNPPQTDPPPTSTDAPTTTTTTTTQPPPPPTGQISFGATSPHTTGYKMADTGVPTLTWSSTAAFVVSVNGPGLSVSDPSGSVALCPAGDDPCSSLAGDYVYTLKVENPWGSNTYMATLTLTGD